MKLRNVFLGVAGTVGATAVANRALRLDGSEFEQFLDGDSGTYRWRGFDIAYTERGDPEDPDVLLFHGISFAASNHTFFRIVETLAEDHHVIAPDLPGFGHSDRPPLLYSSSLYETFVADAIADLSDEDPIVVAASLTGAFAASAVTSLDVERLVLVCPTASTARKRRVWVRSLLRSPLAGEGIYNILVSKGSLRYFNADHAYHNIGRLPDAVLDYEWESAHQPGARFAPASFAGGFLDPDIELDEVLTAVTAPTTIVWGRHTKPASLDRGRSLAEAADTEFIVFDHSALLPHVEQPEAFIDVVTNQVAPQH